MEIWPNVLKTTLCTQRLKPKDRTTRWVQLGSFKNNAIWPVFHLKTLDFLQSLNCAFLMPDNWIETDLEKMHSLCWLHMMTIRCRSTIVYNFSNLKFQFPIIRELNCLQVEITLANKSESYGEYFQVHGESFLEIF